MEIRIVVDRSTPPEGRVDGPTGVTSFRGWLDLMRVLQETLERPEAQATDSQRPPAPP